MRRNKSITELCRELRKNPTPSEKKLWNILRKRQLKGFRFLRQKPIIYKQINGKAFFFIADFYCAERKLIIELDGEIHRKQKAYDQKRDRILERLGYTVLRINNSELADMEMVRKRIITYLQE